MTITQIQCLLKYHGYYSGEVNGIWNEESRDATIRFQEDFGCIKVDGIVGEETSKALKHAVAYGMPGTEKNDFWDNIQYFKKEEFRCQCGGKY